MFNHRWTFILTLGVLLAAAPSTRAQTTAMPASLDDEFAQLAEQIPGFGGLYLDEEGTTHVYLTDLSRTDQVRDLGRRVEVEQGDYDFRDLYAWKKALRPLLAQEGALGLDADEQLNRVRFRVTRDALERFTTTLADYLIRAQVPQEAVVVETAEPVVVQELLTDFIRPVPAGVQITPSFGGRCTLGANAHRPGSGAGFVTASHCTASDVVQGGLDGTSIFQNDRKPASNVAGVETFDPPLFTGGGCPQGRKCRFSDAAFVTYNASTPSAGGLMANPLICATSTPQPVQLNPGAPRRPITKVTLSNSFSGTVLTKVGRSSGCTFGTLKKTCEDVNAYKPVVFLGGVVIYFDSGVTLLCQNQVGALSAPGDSGGPVVILNGEEATLAGILWGGDGSSFVYSPWIWVTLELGAFPDLK